jgi:hypothetical protein
VAFQPGDALALVEVVVAGDALALVEVVVAGDALALVELRASSWSRRNCGMQLGVASREDLDGFGRPATLG